MTSPIVQLSPNRPWAHVAGVTIGPGPWHTSPVYEVSWLEVDYPVSFATQSADWNHNEVLNSDGTRFIFNDYTNYNESRAGGIKSWSSPTSASTQVLTSQEQLLVLLEDFTENVEDIPGPWSDAVSAPPGLASGQTWHIEYEGPVQERTQLPLVSDLQRTVVRLALAGNPDSGYTAAGGESRFHLVPKDLLPSAYGNWGNSAFGPQHNFDSSSFPLLAAFSFGADASTGMVEIVLDNPLANAIQTSGVGVMIMTVDTQSDGVPFVGPPPDWDFFDNGDWQESWSARLRTLLEDDSNQYTLVWQPPRWRYIYEEPTAGVPGDVAGGIDHQVSAFRPRVPTGGVRFDTASDLDPTPSWQDYHPDPRLERGGPAFE